MYLSQVSKGRNNNLDIIRIIAAVMVLFCHAFPISLGSSSHDWLAGLTNTQITFGNLAVCIFFCYAGFLIAGSLERNSSTSIFFKKRCIRLFPSLIVTVFLTTFIVGALLTQIPVKNYYLNTNTYKYLLNSILIPVHSLPGVFENNVYGTAVNGSLWTLPVEFLCYILCLVFFLLKLNRKSIAKYTMILFFPVYVLLFSFLGEVPVLQSALRPIGMFYIGVLLYIYREKVFLSEKCAVICGFILCVFAWLDKLEWVILPCLSYVLMYIGFGIKLPKNKFIEEYEISYQVYLLGFPVQQIICQVFGGCMNPYVNFLLSVPVTCVLGLILYTTVDCKISLYLKRRKSEK